MEEYRLNAAIKIVEAELEHFHHDSGGIMRLPKITKIETQSDFVKYELNDESAIASLTLRPNPKGGCNLSIYFNDSERYAWLLGVPERSELGVSTLLGTHTSNRCLDFCSKFSQYLDASGYLVKSNGDKLIGGRPIYEENIWAQKEYELGRSKDEIYLEWLNRREKAGRSKLINPLDSFKKVIS
jgi:hypothetical protein